MPIFRASSFIGYRPMLPWLKVTSDFPHVPCRVCLDLVQKRGLRNIVIHNSVACGNLMADLPRCYLRSGSTVLWLRGILPGQIVDFSCDEESVEGLVISSDGPSEDSDCMHEIFHIVVQSVIQLRHLTGSYRSSISSVFVAHFERLASISDVLRDDEFGRVTDELRNRIYRRQSSSIPQ